MTGVSELAARPGVSWLGGGPEPDVVLSCRVRLSRNLSEHRFPSESAEAAADIAAADIAAACSEAEQAIREELTPDPFGADSLHVAPGSLDALEQSFLTERSLLGAAPPRSLFVAGDELLAIAIGAEDHLRIISFSAGLRLEEAFLRGRAADQVLERRLNYAVSLDWGYLSTSITNLGTAMRASVLMHLPALGLIGKLAGFATDLDASGFALTPFFAAETLGSVASGSLCLLSNRRTLGSAEPAILAKLEEHVTALVHYERAARQEIRSARGDEIADSAYRALGILSFARSLSAVEARSLVSHLRFGVVAGVVGGVDTDRLTGLLLLVQDKHTELRAGLQAQGEGERNVARAQFVRKALAA